MDGIDRLKNALDAQESDRQLLREELEAARAQMALAQMRIEMLERYLDRLRLMLRENA